MLNQLIKNPGQKTAAGKKEKKKKNNMCLQQQFSAPMHSFDKNYVTNLKKNADNQSFTPLSSIRHQVAAS
jgi:hypothetical protein